jgi:predicted short-subunit dehydrogenase-like oxidoreductase (DUF2520 family)
VWQDQAPAKRDKVSIIGGGRVGATLGFLLARSGYRIRGVSCLRLNEAEEAVRFIGDGAPFEDNTAVVMDSRIVLITTPDDAIAPVARALSETPVSWNSRLVLHCSGFLTSDVLEPLARQGASVATIHPLQTIARPREAVKAIRDGFFCIEGDEDALPMVEALVGHMGSRSLRIDPRKKVLYHAAAVMASNYLISLNGLCVDLMEQAGVPPEKGLEALMPLVQGALDNVKQLGHRKSLTGPISRGDVATVRGHLEALARCGQPTEAVYRSLGLATLELALGGRSGPSLDRAWDLRQALESSDEPGDDFE